MFWRKIAFETKRMNIFSSAFPINMLQSSNYINNIPIEPSPHECEPPINDVLDKQARKNFLVDLLVTTEVLPLRNRVSCKCHGCMFLLGHIVGIMHAFIYELQLQKESFTKKSCLISQCPPVCN